ncbi:MAG TPA: HlyD family efflux transporter periplasmic adaptor subunit [Lacipirellulaceae bacterium]|nr:HlyD family efflux transporter periplasmic adaptor subunit [Lacipirellulaceae bacterium]
MRLDIVLFLCAIAAVIALRAIVNAEEKSPPSQAAAATLAKEASFDKDKQKPDEPTPADAPSKPNTTSSDGDKSPAKDAGKANDKKSADKEPSTSKDDKPKSQDAADAAKAKDSASKSEEKSAKDDKPAKSEEKRKTYKVEPKRLKIDLPLEGTFVANKMTEVPLRPDSWTDYEIVEVTDLGAKVHKGEVLFKFDSEKINDAISDMELEQRLNELTIQKTEEELPRIEKTLKMDFDDADRADREAKEDFKRYNETDRPMAVKTAEFMVKYYNFNLDYEKDELKQLEKMYKADDLTEETEEIVLKRQRNAVEFAQFSLDHAKLSSDEMLNVRLPRADIQIKEALERAALAKARAQLAVSLDLPRARYDLEKLKKARTKSLEKHSKLLGDRDLMELKSPADGVVYYGQCANGRWAETPSLITKYQPHNNVTANSVLMTIVDPRPLYITSTLDEGKRPEVSDGAKAKVTLPSESGDRLGGKVKSISPIPVSSGKFEINFDVDPDEIPDWIVAGMSCKVSVTIYDKAEAIVVPKKAVHDDENDPDTHFVWLVDAEDDSAKPKRHEVKLGKRKEDEIEIVKGLKKGDVVSLDDESDKKKDKDKDE